MASSLDRSIGRVFYTPRLESSVPNRARAYMLIVPFLGLPLLDARADSTTPTWTQSLPQSNCSVPPGSWVVFMGQQLSVLDVEMTVDGVGMTIGAVEPIFAPSGLLVPVPSNAAPGSIVRFVGNPCDPDSCPIDLQFPLASDSEEDHFLPPSGGITFARFAWEPSTECVAACGDANTLWRLGLDLQVLEGYEGEPILVELEVAVGDVADRRYYLAESTHLTISWFATTPTGDEDPCFRSRLVGLSGTRSIWSPWTCSACAEINAVCDVECAEPGVPAEWADGCAELDAMGSEVSRRVCDERGVSESASGTSAATGEDAGTGEAADQRAGGDGCSVAASRPRWSETMLVGLMLVCIGHRSRRRTSHPQHTGGAPRNSTRGKTPKNRSSSSMRARN